jgi:hypothetical protein
VPPKTVNHGLRPPIDSQSQSYFTIASLPLNQFVFSAKPLEFHDHSFFFQRNPSGHSPYVTSSLDSLACPVGSRHGLLENTAFFIVASLFVAADTCLWRRCLSMAASIRYTIHGFQPSRHVDWTKEAGNDFEAMT